jgi:hypothetical protein
MASFITLIVNWNDNGLFPLLRQFVLTPNTVNEFVDLTVIFHFLLESVMPEFNHCLAIYLSLEIMLEKSRSDCGVCNKRLFQRKLTKDTYVLQFEGTIHMVSNN